MKSTVFKIAFLLGGVLLSQGLRAGEEGSFDLLGESGMTALRSEAIRNWEKGRISDAYKKLGVMAAEQPYEAQHRLALGLCLRRQKRYAEAMESYREAKELGGPKGLIALAFTAWAHISSSSRRAQESRNTGTAPMRCRPSIAVYSATDIGKKSSTQSPLPSPSAHSPPAVHIRHFVAFLA